MMSDFSRALCAGAERVSAWADLLDRINVYPIPDGDTGMNLSISFAPMKNAELSQHELNRRLLLAARGNSGNIAVRFFSGFIAASSLSDLSQAVRIGRDRSWKAVKNPRKGTMLSVFDKMNEYLGLRTGFGIAHIPGLIDALARSVLETSTILPDCAAAGVVDSGALGMFIFFQGFFSALSNETIDHAPPTTLFKGKLNVSDDFLATAEQGFCIDLVLNTTGGTAESIQNIESFGDSVVISGENDLVKIHLHTADVEKTRSRIEGMGTIIRWSSEDMGAQIKSFSQKQAGGAVHMVTDAAGSVTRETAHDLDMTLLDSYILYEDRSLPETHVDRDELYSLMRKGVKVRTSQASVYERYSLYERVALTHENTIYLCVGSAFTGNVQVARDWSACNADDLHFTVIDSGAASGRLGLAALVSARYALKERSRDSVLSFVKKTIDRCEEYLFIDTLKYLAEGGRMSKTGAFFGNLLHIKPIVSPRPAGVEKIGTARTTDDQLAFLNLSLSSVTPGHSGTMVLLQYTDNLQWVRDVVEKAVRRALPDAEILTTPLSLTTGVHSGPGTWGVAILPVDEDAIIHGN